MPDPQQLNAPSSNPAGQTPRGIHLFRAITRRLTSQPKSKDFDLVSRTDFIKTDTDSSDSHDSYSDQCSSRTKKQTWTNPSESDSERTQDREVRAILSNLFSRLSLSSPKTKRDKMKPKPKSILRRPVCHIYVRGISGLPTQRVPVSSDYYKRPHRHHHTHCIPKSASSSSSSS